MRLLRRSPRHIFTCFSPYEVHDKKVQFYEKLGPDERALDAVVDGSRPPRGLNFSARHIVHPIRVYLG